MNILITGAARGLGFELCKLFLTDGHRVIALSRSVSPGMQQLLDSTSDKSLQFHICDVSQETEVAATRKSIESTIDSLDIIINNAAVHLEQDQPDIQDLDFSRYQTSFAINSIAPLSVVKHFLSLLQNGAFKSIVNISSEAGSIGNCWREKEYSYCMSKAALNMAMRILQNRVKKDGIRVQLIHPGWVRTDMGGQQADLSPGESAASVHAQIMKEQTDDEAMYIDWNGNPMPW
ncbi:SDR family oxidoreductase [Spirochaeta dissipatitropha]